MKYFPFFIDILGYEARAEEIERTREQPSEDIRESEVVISIERRLNKLKESGVAITYNRTSAGSYHDAWLVITDSIWNAFKTVGTILEAGLPLEVTIGEFERNNSDSIQRSKKAISFLRKTTTEIIPNYKEFYRETHDRNSPKQTFVLLTREAHKHLDFRRIYSEPHLSKINIERKPRTGRI